MRFGSTLLTLFTFSLSIQSSVSASPIPLTQDDTLDLVTVLPTTQCDSSECIDWNSLAGKTQGRTVDVETPLTENEQPLLESIVPDESYGWQVLFESLVSTTTQSFDFITRPMHSVVYKTVGLFNKIEVGSPLEKILKENEGSDLFL